MVSGHISPLFSNEGDRFVIKTGDADKYGGNKGGKGADSSIRDGLWMFVMQFFRPVFLQTIERSIEGEARAIR